MPTPSPVGRPAGADGERTRQRIMDAAMVNIAEAGYANATMKSIARQAGLTSAAIYHYFPSKQELTLAVLSACVDEAMGRLAEAIKAQGPLPARFVALLDEALAIMKDHPAISRFEATVYLESARHAELAAVIADERAAEESLCQRLVDDAVRAGELTAGADREGTAAMLAAIIRGLVSLSATAPRDRHRAAVRAFESLLSGTLFTTL